MGREPLTLRRSLGVLVGFFGVGVIVGPGVLSFSGGTGGTIGEVAVLVAALAYGIGALLAKRFAGAGPLVGPLSMQTASLIVMTPVALLWSPPTHLPSPQVLGSIAVLGIFGTALAYLLYFYLIRHVGATRTSVVTYLLPCTALLWGVLLLGEHVYWYTFAGLALVLAGTMLTNGAFARLRRRGPRAEIPAPVAPPPSMPTLVSAQLPESR
jgi:drug/metabolite transporter (DMT)-like permease